MKNFMSFIFIGLGGIFLRLYNADLGFKQTTTGQGFLILLPLLIGAVIMLFTKDKTGDYPPIWRVALVMTLIVIVFYWITYFVQK